MNHTKKKSLEELFKQALKYHLNRKFNDALMLYKEILNINPNLHVIQNNLGLIYKELDKKKLAINCFKKAITINSKYLEGYNNLGAIYNQLGEYENAIKYSNLCIKIYSNDVKSYHNLAYAFANIGKQKKAIELYNKAIDLDPKFVASYFNLGNIYYVQEKFEEAIKFYKKAININPLYFAPRIKLSHILLMLLRFDEGFKEYEWRIKNKPINVYQDLKLKSNLWNGENLNGKKILILSEQGIGDTIQFARYVYELKEKYKVEIIFRINKNLIHFFDDSKIKIISNQIRIPQHNYHIFLMSLPKYFYQREQKLLNQYYYIKKNKKIFSHWQKKLSIIKTPKIGINWQGSTLFRLDKTRSIPLILFESLFEIPGIEFISLQKDIGEKQIAKFKYKNKLHNFAHYVDIGENSFEDTIEIIRNLDLVISPDSAIAHLSSTLGIKTWILLPKSPSWRWFLKRNTTPWYRNTRLFRQKKSNDWMQVIKKIKATLIKEFKS